MSSEPLITNFFGPGFTQNATSLTIVKADLIAPTGLTPAYEFTPDANNRSEQIALAMVHRWSRNQDQSADSQFRITPFEQSLVFEFNKWQRLFVAQIEIRQDDTLSSLPNPNLI